MMGKNDRFDDSQAANRPAIWTRSTEVMALMSMKYSCNVIWSSEDNAYIATCPEFSGVSAFGDTAEVAVAELQNVLEATIETYRQEGWTLPEPRRLPSHSGKLLVRMPRSLHCAIAMRAEEEGVSLNTLIVALLAEALARRQSTMQ